MEQKTSPAKSSIQFGLLYGAIFILELVITYSFNLGPDDKTYGTIMSIFNYIVFPFTFVFLACKHYKNKFNNGFISMSESIKIGLSVAFIASLVYGLFFAVFNLIFPEYLPDMIESIKSASIKQNPTMTAEQLKMSMSMISKMLNPYISIPLGIVMNCFIALIHSLIVGAIVKKEMQQSF